MEPRQSREILVLSPGSPAKFLKFCREFPLSLLISMVNTNYYEIEMTWSPEFSIMLSLNNIFPE